MPAPRGNQNAKGNAGGYGYDAEYRKKQGELKKLVLDEMLRMMKEGTKTEKIEIIKRIGPRCLPDELDVNGEGTVYVINRGGQPLGSASAPSVDSGQ